MEHGVVTQRATVLLLSLLCFVSLLNTRLGGPENAKVCDAPIPAFTSRSDTDTF